MKLLLVFDNHELSGADKAAVNLLRHARAADGIETRAVVCMDNRLAGASVSMEQLSRPQPARENYLQRILRGVGILPALARHCAWADVVIPVSPPAALWAGIAGAWARRPVAPWVHYDLDGLAREGLHEGRKLRDWLMLQLYRHLVPSFRRLIFASERSRASFVRRAPGAAPQGWIVLPNLYDPAGFGGAAPACEAALRTLKRTGAPLFLIVGRVFRQKRWEDAIAAAERLHERGRDFNLAFIGDGVEMTRLKARAAASPAARRIHVLGADPNAVAALALGDALLLTSLYEAWPLVILECFDLGVPVFAYDCPSGPGEMLGRSGERGTLVNESPQAMAGALETWFWATSPAERAASAKRMDSAAKLFLQAHRPPQALRAWVAGLPALTLK